MTLVIDMDSHLRDSYILDQIYALKGEKVNDGAVGIGGGTSF